MNPIMSRHVKNKPTRKCSKNKSEREKCNKRYTSRHRASSARFAMRAREAAVAAHAALNRSILCLAIAHCRITRRIVNTRENRSARSYAARMARARTWARRHCSQQRARAARSRAGWRTKICVGCANNEKARKANRAVRQNFHKMIWQSR